VGIDFYPEDGTQVIRTADLSFEAFEDGLIKASAGARSILLFPRGRTSGDDSSVFFVEGGFS
jgi:hypothetical protein